MSDTVIRVENLGKRYRIGLAEKQPDNLREALIRLAGSPFRYLRTRLRESSPEETIWALKNVSFEVKRGEVVGIIGRNGAGKSTLLKILSRITDPTEGRAVLQGRVGSLLEVGAGFHPELTGRENIYLNGTILGMKRAEIEGKFDEIVDFSGVEKFIDTPVKRYSSGMYVRLAFAVAAHLEPEILLVDEVLAVGDAAFQKKCLGKMGDVAREGRTVLFVSHNMGAIQGLCRRTMWIEQGAIRADGDPQKTVSSYLDSVTAHNDLRQILTPLSDLEIERVILRNDAGKEVNSFRAGEALVVEIHYLAKKTIEYPYFWIGIVSQNGHLFGASMLLDGHRPRTIEGKGFIKCRFRYLPLLPQMYTVRIGVRDKGGTAMLVKAGEAASFRVSGTASELGLTGELADSDAWGASSVLVPYEWYLPGEDVKSVDVLNAISSKVNGKDGVL